VSRTFIGLVFQDSLLENQDRQSIASIHNLSAAGDLPAGGAIRGRAKQMLGSSVVQGGPGMNDARKQ
jgi:hypothetical protein